MYNILSNLIYNLFVNDLLKKKTLANNEAHN